MRVAMSSQEPTEETQSAHELTVYSPVWSWEEPLPNAISTQRPPQYKGNAARHYFLGGLLGAIAAGSAVFLLLGGMSRLNSPKVPSISTPSPQGAASEYFVTGIYGLTITALSSNHAVVIVSLSTSTTYKLGDLPGTVSDIKVGDLIIVKGKKGIGGNITAGRILILLPTLSGTAVSVNVHYLVLIDSTRRMFTIDLSQSTKIVSSKTKQILSASTLHAGSLVTATCIISSTGSFTAVSMSASN
jgi:hypothetical protein